ncbi:MAG: DUF2110 family protein [Candidatus Bathyarchaeia archaeon]
MTTVVLASKIYNENQLAFVEGYLKTLFKGLKVNVKSVEATVDGRVQVFFSGEDEKAALSYLKREIGLCPSRTGDLRKFLTVKGYITELGRSHEEIHVDIGVSYPKPLYADVPLMYLQAQLADGRKIALQKIIELYGFSENTPITVKIANLSEDHVEAEVAETQLATYRRWIKSLFDRLIVLGASQPEIWKALKNAKCQNDIIAIEPLGLFEHAVVCKLGTDSVGLIPKMGKHIPDTKLEVFKPKTLIEFFENPNIIK